MERLTIAATFQKSIESLKNTECSQKEKVALFVQIADCIESPALLSNSKYLTYVSSALTILFMFCEELDSVTRISAEENLNRIVRFSTPSHIVSIHKDLFHEIKKNGNERSLRIALNLFGHYCHLIKQRKIRPYVINLLPCILSIAKRKEQQLIETLSEFVVQFCDHLQICLNENEVLKLMEEFIGDAVTTECPVKRRCAAANAIQFIEHSRRPDVMAKHALTTCLDTLVKVYIPNNIVGALGLLRLLLPVVLRLTNKDHIVIAKTIEIIEFCLHLLHDPSHTVINAALECLNVIFDNPHPRLKHLLCSHQLKHMEILRKRRTLKHQIFKTKSSTSSIEFGRSKNNLFSASFASSPAHVNPSATETGFGHETFFDEKRTSTTGDEKNLLTCSDIEMESFKTTDFDTSRGDLDRGYDSSNTHSPAIGLTQRKLSTSGDTASLKSQTDSIGSFFTSILAHPNTESVSKFFRGGDSTQPTTPKGSQTEGDSISVISLGSQMSINSHNSSTFDLCSKTDDPLPEIEFLTDQDVVAIQIESKENTATAETATLLAAEGDYYCFNERALFIGHIANQPIVHYTVRLIAMKFLLAGTQNELVDDKSVRVSIKNLSLAAIAHCVALQPSVLSLTMEKCDDLDGGIDAARSYQSSDDGDDSSEDTIDNEATSHNVSSVTADADNDAGDPLVIKDDHFGQSDAMTSSYFDFMLPLSKSADHVLLTQLNSSQTEANRSRNEKLNMNLSELLSKSDIVPSTSRSAENSSFRAVNVKPALPPTTMATPTMMTPVTKYTIDRCCGVDIELQRDPASESMQSIEDVLLYSNHSDPILRANVQLIVGNYLVALLGEASSITSNASRFLQGGILMNLLLHALEDDIHIVVKQSLNALKQILPVLLRLRDVSGLFQGENESNSESARKLLSINDSVSSNRLIEHILDTALFVHHNKYWVVQSSYADFIAKIDFSELSEVIDADFADNYREQFLSHIYTMLGDNDQRVRKAAADALSESIECYMNTSREIRSYEDRILLNEMISDRIFTDLPSPLCNLMSDQHKSNQIEEVLGRCLLHLSNFLLEIECKQRQFGVVKSIVNLLKAFNPITYRHIWTEFCFVKVSISMMTQNYAIGTDLTCHSDLISISTQLMAARLSTVDGDADDRRLCLSLLDHDLKLANIFQHIFSGQKPLFIPKGQKSDIFMNARELQALNSRGYFGNDYFYLKIYKIIKLMHDNYKITITADIDTKLLALLRASLQSLSVLLEMLDTLEESGATLKLIEEMLPYLRTFLHYVPNEAVECTKRLLKFMFSMNFTACREKYEWFLRNSEDGTLVAAEVFEHLRNFDEFAGIKTIDTQPAVSVPPSPLRSGSKLLGFASSDSSSMCVDPGLDLGKIKLFEPIVIQCLKLFTKSNCETQAVILNMICQVLQFHVSYSLLDSNNVFIEFVLKLLEMIETGTVKNSHIVIPSIIKFLFHLSKQKEATLITIPKIINVTDTLLANSLTQNGYIEALRELAFESIGYADANDLTPTAAKELNTQKEVAFSMLLKFIENPIIQKVICIVLLKESGNSTEMNVELAVCLLQILTDHKCILKEMEQYQLFARLIDIVHGKISGDGMVEILLKKSRMVTFHDMAVQTLIVNTIASNRTESDFIADVMMVLERLGDREGAAAYANDLICKHFHRQISSGFIACDKEAMDKLDDRESNMVSRTVAEQIQMFEVFQQFLNGVANLLSKFDDLSLEFHQNVKAKEELIEQVTAFVRTSTSSRAANSKLKIFDVILATVIAKTSENDKILLMGQLKKLNDTSRSDGILAQVRTHLTQALLKIPMNADDVENLLRTSFVELTLSKPGHEFLLSMNAKFSTSILEKLQPFLQSKVLTLEALGFAVDLIADCNEKALSLAMNLLLDEFLLESNRDCFNRKILMKRIFAIFDRLLKRLLGDDGLSDMEVFESTITVDMFDQLAKLKEKYAKSDLLKLCSDNVTKVLNTCENNEDASVTDESVLNSSTIVAPVDEEWLLQQAAFVAFSSNSICVYQILSEIRNESNLQQIFESPRFDRRILSVIIERSFDDMIKRFKQDCFQHNPHMIYLKIPVVLRLAIDALIKDIELMSVPATHDDVGESIVHAASALTTMLSCIERTECECLVYVEAQFVETFIGKHFLRTTDFDAFVRFVCICLTRVDRSSTTNQSNDVVDQVQSLCECVNAVLRQRHLVADINSHLVKYNSLTNVLVPTVYKLLKRFMASATFVQSYRMEHLIERQRQRQHCEDMETERKYAMAIFIGKFVECCYTVGDETSSAMITSNAHHRVQLMDLFISLAIAALRIDVFYFFAVTPCEVLQNFDWDLGNYRQTNRLPSLPIDCLNDVEIVEKFVRRINIFGFLSRTNFEEFFMSLLLLINKPTDFDVVDAQEQHQIKSICLKAIVELLLSCKMFATVGCRDAGQFHHIPRWPRPKADSIGLKKLYKLQTLFASGPCIFYMPNLERKLTGCNGSKYSSCDNIIGSNTFAPNQCELNVIWHIIEGQSFASHELNVSLKNMRYFLEKSTVDMNSSVQVIFDVFTQLIEENCALVLPELSKFCEICENREQFRWIKNAMTKLHESVHMENAVCHKHIIYCLCKSYSILIPSTSELNQLCTVINGYLKSNHLFVRIAALRGLLCLLESTAKTNTTIGGLSEEIMILRTLIIGYIRPHGIVEESSMSFSDDHTILVWTLNFYLIEITTKFVPDCSLLANSIISANNILKRTAVLEQYLCILHGLERLVIVDVTPKYLREKIEKVALDLVKLENETFSLAALKLLVTCMYMDCAEQLETTEQSNGIVQDEPEVILHSTEKIDILFNRIKVSTTEAAHIYGSVLCQLTCDLVPPKELLTKVIKELLTISQPHCEVIAKVLFQVFRSAIDSSYLPLLQDWLICSLPNFLVFPIDKTIWCLTIIFISASINLQLIKIFPEVLAKYDDLVVETKPSHFTVDTIVARRRLQLFCLACKDFYSRLNVDQKKSFRFLFSDVESQEIQFMLELL